MEKIRRKKISEAISQCCKVFDDLGLTKTETEILLESMYKSVFAAEKLEKLGGDADRMCRELIKPNSTIWRRFIPIGTKEEMDRLQRLIYEKNLSREDLLLILHTLKLNPNIRTGVDSERGGEGMELRKCKIVHATLTGDQTDLRFELFDWLKSKNLSVDVSIELLKLTAAEIQKSAMLQNLNQ